MTTNTSQNNTATFEHIKLLILACLFQYSLDSFLFLRPSPFGSPYIHDFWDYFPAALFYSTYGLALIALPFFIFTLLTKKSSEIAYGLHTFFSALSLLYAHIDHEMLRFMGSHLNFDFLNTYILHTFNSIPNYFKEAIETDKGGAYLSAILLIVPVLFIPSAILIKKWKYNPLQNKSPRFKCILFILFIVITLLIPALRRSQLFKGKGRQERVSPPIVIVLKDLKNLLLTSDSKNNRVFDPLEVQKLWLQANTDPGWTFLDNTSMRKKYTRTCHQYTEKKPNFIIIVIETARALNFKLYNEKALLDATPFITKLAQQDDSTYFLRYITNGQPTIFAFMALHTSIPPHSAKTVASVFTANKFKPYPLYLKEHGYTTAFFSASDPDWDNQHYWISKWYEYSFYEPERNAEDRYTMQQLAKYIKQHPKNKPFAVTTFLMSNHMPFKSREPHLDLIKDDEIQLKIYNTLHYDDDVIREFYEDLKSHNALENTIMIITGDHAYDFGERGELIGHDNARHETTWVPLIIHGKHPLLNSGKQLLPASHIDLAPTILHLAGICDQQAFFGHSLFAQNKNKYAPNFKNNHLAIETNDFSAYFSPNNQNYIYDAKDLRQEENIIQNYPQEAEKLKKRLLNLSAFVDYLYETNNTQ